MSGTIRHALDVFQEYEDADLYAVLRQVGLINEESSDTSSTDDSHSDTTYNAFRNLDTEVKEGGSNFSAGEKQLMVLARLLLKTQKVLILDEATSSMDHKTDEAVTRTIRTGFPDTTMLIIAHRLKVSSCDVSARPGHSPIRACLS